MVETIPYGRMGAPEGVTSCGLSRFPRNLNTLRAKRLISAEANYGTLVLMNVENHGFSTEVH